MIARALRDLATRPRRPVEPPTERCELCAAPLPDAHRHLVDLSRRALACACRPCALLFTRAEAGGDRYRAVPERVLVDDAFPITPGRWAALGVPVGLAFFFVHSGLGRAVACYPGPAGVTEGELDAAVWDAIVAATPLATALDPDVEALIVHGTRGATRLDVFLAPIDRAYDLAGRLRRAWRGVSGGDAADRELAAFFTELRRRARPGGDR